ncbi:hypothetical protein GCM10010869_41590 [Mesorhizobium tianshanense]|uniref:Uncharacterized protein n=1 Tax=Mesorhizobium tianshanense TaxID=39844 RepID=A0A562P235_9HYPH|nr:hypothetical protein IQ26_02383 [Mesorhizobium tianshanense]GLS38564.1 hypothetical protein GCM10010869_41590 [Mesorhizobium tianshanense]
MSVTVHIGSGAVKLDAPLTTQANARDTTSRIPFSETRAAGRVQRPPDFHPQNEETDHARQENTNVDR